MPGDALYDDEGQPQRQPSANPQDQGQPQLTPEQVQQLIQEQLGAFRTESRKDLREFGQQLSQHLSRGDDSQPHTPAQPPSEPQDIAQRILQGDVSAIDERVRTQLEQLAPMLRGNVDFNYDHMNKSTQGQIDSEFGEGVWAEHIAPELGPIFDSLPVHYRGNHRYFTEVVNSIIGKKRDALFEARQKSQAARAAAEKERAERDEAPVMLDGGVPAPPKGRLTAQEREYIAERARSTGRDYNEDHAVRLRNLVVEAKNSGRDFSIDDYYKAFPKEKRSA